MVEPDIPGRISASPTKNPATINLNLSFITQNHQKIYLEAWEQKTTSSKLSSSISSSEILVITFNF